MRILLLFSLIVLLGTPAFASEKVLDIQEVKSSSGVTAWLVEDHTLPLISFEFVFNGSGAINDGEAKQGLSRLLSNTMDEGAGDLPSDKFQKTLSDNSITLYFSSGRDGFGGNLKTLTRNKDKAFELLKLALTKPRFDEEPLERMLEANLSRIKSNMTTPNWISARVFNDLAFEGEPYALNSGGTLSTLPKITADDLRQHVKNYLTQDRLTIGVAGDITKEELTKVLDDVFGDLPKTSTEPTFERFSLKNTGNQYLFKKDTPQTLITVALPSFQIDDPDYYALRVMNQILGASGFGSRLMEQAREKEGLTYGIYSGFVHQDYIDAITVSTSTKNESVPRMLEIIQQETQKMAEKEVSKEKLKKIKSYMVGSLPLSLTSTGSLSSILLSLQIDNRSIDYLDQYSDRINAVTAKDVQRVAQRLFKDKSPLVVMVGSPDIEEENLIVIESLSNVE